MELCPLGRTGVDVSRLGLGTMVLGAGCWVLGAGCLGQHRPDTCHRVINTALDAGIYLVDTADVYGDGENESIVGAAISHRRDDVVLCTKFHDRAGNAAPSTEQPPSSILCRTVERDVLPTVGRHSMGALVWSPLSGGWLTGKYRRDQPAPSGSRGDTNPDHFDGANAAKSDAVEPGITIDSADVGWTPPGLADDQLTRTPSQQPGWPRMTIEESVVADELVETVVDERADPRERFRRREGRRR